MAKLNVPKQRPQVRLKQESKPSQHDRRKRFGRHVEGANIHHNPTPGPVGGDWLYGHNWVCFAWLVKHLVRGIIALPILSRLYLRQVDIDKLACVHGSKNFLHEINESAATR
jgi:hypothetical protein